MCIICSKPAGVGMVGKKKIKRMFANNPHGAGYAFLRDGVVFIRKGFMEVKPLLHDLKEADIQQHEPAIFHFRLATHGLRDGGNCHPFPISDKADVLRSTVYNTDCAVAHNGIFHKMPDDDTLSDTMKFVKLVLSARYIVDNLQDRSVKELLQGYCGTSSKLAFLNNDGVTMFGNWSEHNGLFFSNDGYKQERWTGFASRSYRSGWPSLWRNEIGYSTKELCDCCNVQKATHFDSENGQFCDDCADYIFDD